MKNITFYQYYSLKIMEIQKSKILVKKIMILLKHHKLSLQKKVYYHLSSNWFHHPSYQL